MFAVSFMYDVFQFEVDISAKFLSEEKRGTSGHLHAAFGRKMKVHVIKHDSYFRLDICRGSWLRNSNLGLGICV